MVLREGLVRQLEKATTKLSEIDAKKELLKEQNIKSERAIQEKLQST